MSVSDAPPLGRGEAALAADGPVPSRLAHVGDRRRWPAAWIAERRLARAALGGLLAAGAVTVLCAQRTIVLSPDSVRPLPRALAGPLAGLGPDLHLGGVIAVFTVMCLCYGALVRFGARLSWWAIAAAVLAVNGLMVLGPPLLSTDVFSYGVYGRMSALYHFDPYVLGPAAIAHDAWYPFVGAPWVGTPTAYGPVFTAISAGLAHLSIGAAALVYKLIAAAGSLLAVTATAVAARRLGRDPPRAALLVGLNPVLVVYAVGGDHNDLLMLAALAWAIVALTGERARTAGGLLVTAAAVKVTGAILLPFALAAGSRRVVVGALLGFVAIGAVSTFLFGFGPLHLLGTLEQIQGHGGAQSVPGRIAAALGLGPLGSGAGLALQLALVVAVAGLLVAVRRGVMDWITGTGWAIVAVLVTSTFLLPWYVVWLLPFAALSRSRGLRAASLALTGIGMTSL